MASIRTLIVDDEPIARRVLREELDQFSGIEIAGEAENGIQALEQIHNLKPDLVFLDLGGTAHNLVWFLHGGWLLLRIWIRQPDSIETGATAVTNLQLRMGHLHPATSRPHRKRSTAAGFR
jgi:DNA-binding NarL/FixJ family response regulator